MFWLVWGYTVVLRLLELLFAKMNLKQAGVKPVQEPLYIAMVMLHSSFLAMLLLSFWEFKSPLKIHWFSVFLLVQVLRFWTLATLGRSWNTRIVLGSRTKIVTQGPFRLIRHPNYLVVILEFIFLPLMFGWVNLAIIFSVINAVILFFRIQKEEAVLAKNQQWWDHFRKRKRFVPWLF